LPGYENSAPVRIGNDASKQLQLDIFGEVTDAMFQALKAGMAPSASRAAGRIGLSGNGVAAAARRRLGGARRLPLPFKWPNIIGLGSGQGPR
jgi:hypothetical protein